MAPLVVFVSVATLANGCATLSQMSQVLPTAGDSLLAKRQLDETLDAYWRGQLVVHPAMALANGYFVNGYPELSSESVRGKTRASQGVVRALERINADALTPSGYITLLTLRWEAESDAEASLFYWSDFSGLSPAESSLREVLQFLESHPLRTGAQVERYLYLLEAVPFQLQRLRAALSERQARGYLASRDLTRSGLAFVRALRTAGEDAPWALSPARISALEPTQRAALLADLREIVAQRLNPALDSLATWIERDYISTTIDRPGLWQYGGGKEHYRHLLRRKSSLDIQPEEAHKVGLTEMRRIDALLAAVRQRMQWKGTVQALHDSLRRSATALDDSALVAAVRAAQHRMAPMLASRVLPSRSHALAIANPSANPRVPQPSATLPAPASPERVPPASPWIAAADVTNATSLQRMLDPDGAWHEDLGNEPAGHLIIGARWGHGGGPLAVAARTFALASPGRALQRVVTMTADSSPAFRRWTESRGYVEGWQEYAASLAGELGLYATPRSAYARLLDEGFAAALLVVDTGVHYLGWTRAQALSVLQPYSLESPATLDSIFVERVVNDPGGAGVATLGSREFAAQRTWMERELGSDFDLREWHSAVLSAGAVPLPILATHLEQWLYETRRAKAAAREAARKPKPSVPPPKKP